MITFRRTVKENGTQGWLVLEKDALGQMTQHKCKFFKPQKKEQQPQQQRATDQTTTTTPTITNKQVSTDASKVVSTELQCPKRWNC